MSKMFIDGEEIEFDGAKSTISWSKNGTKARLEGDDESDAIGYAMYTGPSGSSEQIGMSIGYTEQHLKLGGLQQIAGVGRLKAEALYEGGYERIEDIKKASQQELSNVEGIGMALAARIKADVGGVGVDAEEIVDELEDSTPYFLEENTLMVNVNE